MVRDLLHEKGKWASGPCSTNFVINDDVDECFTKVREILHAERMKRTRQTGLIPFVRELMG